jgi:hypothetical protein
MTDISGEPSGRELEPHEFKPRNDDGLAAFAAGSGAAGAPTGAVPPAVVTGHYIRESLCDEPGCNRPELDPIHQATEA